MTDFVPTPMHIRIAEYRRAGKTIGWISNETGMATDTVSRHLREMGLAHLKASKPLSARDVSTMRRCRSPITTLELGGESGSKANSARHYLDKLIERGLVEVVDRSVVPHQYRLTAQGEDALRAALDAQRSAA